MQGIVARRNNFAEPILAVPRSRLQGLWRSDRPPLRPGHRSTRPKMPIPSSSPWVQRRKTSKPPSTTCARQRRRQRRLHPRQRHSPLPRGGRRRSRSAARRTSSSSSGPTKRCRGDNPLGRDIRTALRKAVQHTEAGPAAESCPHEIGEMPHIFAGTYGLGSRDFRPEHIFGAFEYATAGRARKDGKTAADGGASSFSASTILTPSIRQETPSLLPEGAVAVRFHSIGGWGAITTGKNLGAILGDLNDLLFERDGLVDDYGNPKEIIHVSANPKYGSEKKGAPTSYFMVAAKDRIRVNCDLRHVTVVLCCDPKAFTHTNPLDGMQQGGSLVWESDAEGRAGVGAAPAVGAQADHRQQHSRLHAARLRHRQQGHQPRRPAAPHAGQRLPGRLLCRVAAARRVRHHAGAVSRSRAQAVCEEVRQAWATRLCNSNMEVMLQGFEQVKEIAIGELAAPIAPACAGVALLPILEEVPAGAASSSCTTGGAGRTTPPVGQAERTPDSTCSRRSMRSSVPASATTSPRRRFRH